VTSYGKLPDKINPGVVPRCSGRPQRLEDLLERPLRLTSAPISSWAICSPSEQTSRRRRAREHPVGVYAGGREARSTANRIWPVVGSSMKVPLRTAVEMVRRYAHLAPEHLEKAAARILPVGTKLAAVAETASEKTA
jgi:hypothetical protein